VQYWEERVKRRHSIGTNEGEERWQSGEDFVLIAGCARTGTKLCRSIINSSDDINVTNELHYLAPWWIRRDVVRTTGLSRGLPNGVAVTRFIDLLYSTRLPGTFWKDLSRSGRPHPNTIMAIPRERLEVLIKESERTPRDIFSILLREHARSRGKPRAGAKLPVHIASMHVLVRWYPYCRVVHTVRDPRAIYCSMVRADLRSRSRRPLYRFTVRLKRLLYVVYQYRIAASLHREQRNSIRYILVRFEDLVSQPEAEIQKLCCFLGVKPAPAMLRPPLKNSSFVGSSNEAGFDKDALVRWRSERIPVAGFLMRIVLRKAMKDFGYERLS